MSDYDRIANASGAPYTWNGTVYEMRAPAQDRLGPDLTGSALASGFCAANIRRCCDGDDHAAQAALPDRHTATLADALRWRAQISAAGLDPDRWFYAD